MERHLILLCALVALGAGLASAVLRPGILQIGQSSGLAPGPRTVLWGGAPRRFDAPGTPRAVPGGRARWERFQGRGPGGAK